MVKKRITSVFLVVVLLLSIISLFGCTASKGSIKILDDNSQEIATVTELNPLKAKLSNDGYSAYVECVVDNALELIKQSEECSDKKAEKLLLNNTVINTYFDSNVYSNCDKVYKESELNDFAFVLTNINGGIICAYSSNNETNFALEKNQPYSSFKPLSVYAPAIEKGIVNYSTMYVDEPIKKVVGESGELVDWPQNPTKTYSNEATPLCDGIKYSLNTTAINCLNDLGVQNSIDFLTNNFKINLDREREIIEQTNEDEVLSKIGLGYMEAGISCVDMAGYYQIFADKGQYVKPTAVKTITDLNGQTLYEPNLEKKVIISEDSAWVMNLLLQNTLSEGGTAQKAKIENLSIGGKTGTGENASDNWFVGFTPEYCFSIWHGESKSRNNECTSLFPKLAKGITFDYSKHFRKSSDVHQIAYCSETGKLLNYNCTGMELGYYKKNSVPQKCDSKHN